MAPAAVMGKRPIQRTLADQIRWPKSEWVLKDMRRVFPSVIRRDDGATGGCIGSRAGFWSADRMGWRTGGDSCPVAHAFAMVKPLINKARLPRASVPVSPPWDSALRASRQGLSESELG